VPGLFFAFVEGTAVSSSIARKHIHPSWVGFTRS